MNSKKNVTTSPFTFAEKLALFWFLIDAFTHLSIELGYVWLAFTTTAKKADNYMGHVWRKYARADSRWAVRDPVVMSIEIATVAVGVLCLAQIYGVVARTNWRHPLQIIISYFILLNCHLFSAESLIHFRKWRRIISSKRIA
jgi:hypothetical protein